MDGPPHFAARPIGREPREEHLALMLSWLHGVEGPACSGRGTSRRAGKREFVGLERNPDEGRAFGGPLATIDEERRGDLYLLHCHLPSHRGTSVMPRGRKEASTWIPSNTLSRGAVPILAGS